MKTKLILAIIAVMAFLAQPTMAQDKKASNMVTIKIKTSAVCGMCKETIEKTMAFEKGVKTSELDVKTKIVTVTYNTEKTSPEKIKLAISKVGYDADEVAADPKAYAKLSPCCQKGNKMH